MYLIGIEGLPANVPYRVTQARRQADRQASASRKALLRLKCCITLSIFDNLTAENTFSANWSTKPVSVSERFTMIIIRC